MFLISLWGFWCDFWGFFCLLLSKTCRHGIRGAKNLTVLISKIFSSVPYDGGQPWGLFTPLLLEGRDLASFSSKAGGKLDRKARSAKNKEKLHCKLNFFYWYPRTFGIAPHKEYFVCYYTACCWKVQINNKPVRQHNRPVCYPDIHNFIS